MSTYTIIFQCRHTRSEACQHCTHDESYISPERCPDCQAVRMPRFGVLPSSIASDDQEDDDIDDNDDEGDAKDDDPHDTEYFPGDALDDNEEDYKAFSFDDLAIFSKELRNRGTSSLNTNATTEPPSAQISPIEPELDPYFRGLRTVYTRPKVVIQRKRKLSEVPIYDEYRSDDPLLSETAPFHPNVVKNQLPSLASLNAEVAAHNLGLGDNLDMLRNNPQFQQLRQILQTNPHLLGPTVQQINAIDPYLTQLIWENPDQFCR